MKDIALGIVIGIVFPVVVITSASVYGYFPKKRFLYKAGIILLISFITLVIYGLGSG